MLKYPVDTATASDIPLTATGVERAVRVPSPSWPSLFAPQHFTAPPETTAHVCHHPTAIEVASFNPLTVTGVDVEATAVPLPSCPELLLPQHCTVPPDRRAHVL